MIRSLTGLFVSVLSSVNCYEGTLHNKTCREICHLELHHWSANKKRTYVTSLGPVRCIIVQCDAHSGPQQRPGLPGGTKSNNSRRLVPAFPLPRVLRYGFDASERVSGPLAENFSTLPVVSKHWLVKNDLGSRTIHGVTGRLMVQQCDVLR